MKNYMIEYINANGSINSKYIQAKDEDAALEKFRNTVSHDEVLSIELY